MSAPVIWKSETPLRAHAANLASMLNRNAATFGDRPAYQESRNGSYHPLSWSQFRHDICAIQTGLSERGLEAGDRVAIVSRNRQEMLELELAVMAMGAVAVPIFAGYTPPQTEALVNFCEPRMVAVAEQAHFEKLGSPAQYDRVIHFSKLEHNPPANLIPFAELAGTRPASESISGEQIAADSVCLMMYTSGTMGKPKCVQLTHRNILSQQAAGKDLWPLSERDRFLSYLPWHHSYGGIFEKYSALTNGAVLSLEHGYGKDLDTLIENWRRIRPTVFYSVPLIYQALLTRSHQDAAIERLLFHAELRYFFTAAAPLPKVISDEFERRNIAVLEGWGLTETSPCCTVTQPGARRQPGVVGHPIPGVSVAIAPDGEILVKGPNVMTGYYRNPEETAKVLTDDGWFCTGDVGEFTDLGLKLVSRKDRIFKLTNAEKVVAAELENMITGGCPYLAWAYVTGSGRDYPVALLFPNRAIFACIPEGAKLPGGCCRPHDVATLAHCLGHCLAQVNRRLDAEYSRMPRVMLVDHELSIENEELTPSMKMSPNTVGRIFKANIERLYDPASTAETSTADSVYIIRLDR
ncbi:AMP-binding protein [candidate division KSB1 bacterium]|nr:AMP-binding protein [candidate division KSB1 bacterium]